MKDEIHIEANDWARQNNENDARAIEKVNAKWGEHERTQNVHSEYHLFDEYSRGIMYRGGEDADVYMKGYAFGWIAGIIFLVVLYLIGLSMP